METETNINHQTMKISKEDIDEAFDGVEELIINFNDLVT